MKIVNTTASSGGCGFQDVVAKRRRRKRWAKRKNVAALINLSKLSATEFIGYVPRQEEDSIVTEIEKYDGKTGQRKTILKNEFFYQGASRTAGARFSRLPAPLTARSMAWAGRKKTGRITATLPNGGGGDR